MKKALILILLAAITACGSNGNARDQSSQSPTISHSASVDPTYDQHDNGTTPSPVPSQTSQTPKIPDPVTSPKPTGNGINTAAMPNADKMVIQHGKNIDYSVFGKENGNSIWWIEEQKVLKRYRATEVVTTESFTYTIGEILCGVQSAYRLTGVSDFEHGGYCVAQVWAKRTLRVREGGGGGGSPVDLCLVGSPNGPYGERARSYNFAGSDNEYERMLSQSWRSNGTKLPIGGVDAPGQVGDVTSHLIVFDGGWAPRLDLTTISAVDDLQHNSSPLVRIG